MAQLPAPVRSACRYFAYYLGNGTLAPDVMAGCDYLPTLAEGYGSSTPPATAWRYGTPRARTALTLPGAEVGTLPGRLVACG